MLQATPTRSLQTPSRGADEPFPSPLFKEVTARFDNTTRRVILETGATSAGNLALLEGKRCRLLVADAARALSALSEEPPETGRLRDEVGRLLFDAGEPIDTVLCWDLLNYLNPPVLSAFAERLATLMAPTGVVHAYVHSAHAAMPPHPQRYAALGDGRVARLDHDAAGRKAPRYSARELEKHAFGLHVERSMLLRNGMQEFLLRLDPSRSGPRSVKPLYRKTPARV